MSKKYQKITKKILLSLVYLWNMIFAGFKNIWKSGRELSKRRPHKSFKMTKRRDFKRSLKLPGFLNFTTEVSLLVYKNLNVFLPIMIIYAGLALIFGAATDQEAYNRIFELMKSIRATEAGEVVNDVSEAFLLGFSVLGSGGSLNISETQQLFMGLTAILMWLTVVWLLREIYAGRKPKVRDGLYNSGAPIFSTFLLLLLIIIQILPLGLLGVVYVALSGIGMITYGFSSMIFFSVVVVALGIVLHWITTSMMALIVVTLPGMYPGHALRAAADLISGRRFRIMLRLVWMILCVIVAWFLLLVPVIVLDGYLRSSFVWMSYIPLVPTVALLLSAGVIVWTCSYIYVLYRKVVADNDPPAK